MTPTCRSCGSRLQVTVVDLGRQPLANSYLRPEDVADERRYPLHARYCEVCHLVQVDDVVPAADIFGDYAYFSSVSDSWVEHAHRYADRMVAERRLSGDDLVVELASNDGYLLQWFVAAGIPVVGVEPAANVAEAARERGVATRVAFFGADEAERIVAEEGRASLVVANNVLAHVPDLNDFVAGIARLLRPDGLATIEFPHLLNLVEQTQFDTIYHEHYSYFSLLAARGVLARHGLEVVDVDQLPTHGGSLRLHVAHLGARAATDAVEALVAVEVAARLDDPAGFADFGERVHQVVAALVDHLRRASADGRTVVAYGAAAKGNTLLNAAGITTDDLAYVVDLSPHKQGLLLPGSHLPIHAPERLLADRPDEVLVLPWNLRDEIEEQMAEVRSWGGRFVTAIPTLAVR